MTSTVYETENCGSHNRGFSQMAVFRRSIPDLFIWKLPDFKTDTNYTKQLLDELSMISMNYQNRGLCLRQITQTRGFNNS